MYNDGKTAKFGKIPVRIYRDRWYIIRFTHKGKRYNLTIGEVTPEVFKIACARAQEINSDILLDRFDSTLAKYSPKHAHALEVEEKKKELTVFDLWERYKQDKENIVKKSTQSSCWKSTTRCISKVTPDALKLDNANQFLKEVLEIYSPGTLKPIFGDINAAVNYGVSLGLVEDNPYAKLKLPKTQKKPIECFTEEELKEIIAAFYNDTYKSKFTKHKHSYYAYYIHFIILTGCRYEEAIALTQNDIKKKGGKTRILFNKVYSKGHLIPSTKTNEIRLFNCNSQLVQLLEDCPKISNDHNLLFPSNQGGFINHSNWRRRYWKPVVDGLVDDGKVAKYLKPYATRSSAITRWVRAGFDINTIAALAGNSPEVIIQNYLAVKEDITLPEL